MSKGILVSDEGTNLSEKQYGYSSLSPRLQVALNKTPAHLGLESVRGTGIKVFASGPHLATETLLTVKHDLGYTPKVLVYYHQPSTGIYTVGTFFYGTGAIDDSLTYEIDNRTLIIKHTVVDYLAGSDYTSTAPTGIIKIKYLIFSNPVEGLTNDGLNG